MKTREKAEYTSKRLETAYKQSRDKLFKVNSLPHVSEMYRHDLTPNVNPEDKTELKKATRELVYHGLNYYRDLQEKSKSGGHSISDTLKQKDRPVSPFDFDRVIETYTRALDVVEGRRQNPDSLIQVVRLESEAAAGEIQETYQKRNLQIPTTGFLGFGGKDVRLVSNEADYLKNQLDHLNHVTSTVEDKAIEWGNDSK